MGTQYRSGVGFLLDLHRDIDQLRIKIEVTSLYDNFFHYHNDVIALTWYNVKLNVIVIPICNVVLISDKDENVINNGKQFVLFYFRSSRPEVFCKKSCSEKFRKIYRKILVPESLFLKF